MKQLKKLLVILLKNLDMGSAVAVRLTKLTGKSKVPIHPKHFLSQKPWFTNYLTKNDRVLDLGSGNGQNAIKAAKLCKRLTAVEIDHRLQEIAQISAKAKRIKNLKFAKGNLEKTLAFKDDSFDKTIFLDVLEHLNNRDQILKEIKRVLKPNGTLFLGVPNSQTSWKKLQRSVGLNSFSDPDHKIEFTQKSIINLLKKHSFIVKDFGLGKYDTSLRGLYDIIGAISITVYKKITEMRQKKALSFPQEASGFEIVAQNIK